MLAALVASLGRSRVRRLVITAHDVIVVTAAFPFSILLRENFNPSAQHIVPALLGSTVLLTITLFVFRAMGVQQMMWRYSSPGDFLNLARALFVATAFFFPAMFLIDRLDGIPRSVLVIFWFVAFVGLCSTRIVYSWAVTRLQDRRPDFPYQAPCRILILGEVKAALSIIQSLSARWSRKTDIVGIATSDAERGRTLLGVEVLGCESHLRQVLTSLDVSGRYPHAIVLGETSKLDQPWQPETLAVAAPGTSVFRSTETDQLFSFIECEPRIDRLPKIMHHRDGYHYAKRLIDVILSFLGLLLLLPLMAVIAGLICVLHGAPVIFAQVRAGRGLEEFRLAKFRTMKELYDVDGGALDDRSRVTRLGAILRATRLDELPQLWNVLCGDMSLVGPRPLLRRDMPTDKGILSERYSIRPGITGWAQVNGGKKIGQDEKMALDIYYIRHASGLLDVKIAFMTIYMMLFGEKIGANAIDQAIKINSSNGDNSLQYRTN